MRILTVVFAVAVALVGLAFHVRNNQDITLDYFLGVITLDLSWLVVGTLVCGAVLGILGMSATWLRLRREVARLSRRNEQARRELSSLRAVALKDAG